MVERWIDLGPSYLLRQYIGKPITLAMLVSRVGVSSSESSSKYRVTSSWLASFTSFLLVTRHARWQWSRLEKCHAFKTHTAQKEALHQFKQQDHRYTHTWFNVSVDNTCHPMQKNVLMKCKEKCQRLTRTNNQWPVYKNNNNADWKNYKNKDNRNCLGWWRFRHHQACLHKPRSVCRVQKKWHYSHLSSENVNPSIMLPQSIGPILSGYFSGPTTEISQIHLPK